MNNFDKSMQKIFDVAPKEEVKEVKTKVAVVNSNDSPDMQQDLNDAYQQSRENLQGIIDQGTGALEEILEISKQSQNPRAFEVYGLSLIHI